MDVEPRPKNPNWKVKVYLLNDVGNWDDCGTGTLEMCKIQKDNEESYSFKVTKVEDKAAISSQLVSNERLEKLRTGEPNSNIILSLPVLKNYEFEKQGGKFISNCNENIDSIISWLHQDIAEEIALSFLDTVAANETWRMICAYLGKNSNELKRHSAEESEPLPLPELESLELIRHELETRKSVMADAVLKNEEFLEKLFHLFDDCEDLEIRDKLGVIHDIVKMMVFVDDLNFIQQLLSDKYYMQVFGALEYDTENPEGYHPKYREFLKNESTYKPVIEFKDPKILNKIHLNFRITFLRDTVVSSIIDDPLTNQFNSMIYYNNHEIYDHIMSHSEYFDELFKKFNERLKDSIGFLYEFIQIVKTLIQIENKVEFAKQMVNRNIFSVIGRAYFQLHTSNQPDINNDKTRNILKINLIEVLTMIIQLQINAFIDYLRTGNDSLMLFNSLTQNLFFGDQGLQIQITELVKYFIDSTHEKRNEILDYFYDNFLPAFFEHYKKQEKSEQFICFVQQYIDMLTWCLKLHGYRIRHYIIHHKLLQALYIGFPRKEKLITISIIRLVKSILVNKDEFLLKYVINGNLLDDIFEVYLQNSSKDNLINSSCLDLFDTIRKENLKKMLSYFIERFSDRIKEKNLERHFKKLFLTFEKLNDTAPSKEDSQSNQNNVQIIDGTFPPIFSEQEPNANYSERELNCLEDESYFDQEEAANQEPNLKEFPKTSVEIPQIPVKEKIVEKKLPKIRLKNFEEEEFAFAFGSKVKSQQQSPIAKLKIQFSINTKPEPDINFKRSGSDLEADEEIKDESKIEVEKKQKIE